MTTANVNGPIASSARADSVNSTVARARRLDRPRMEALAKQIGLSDFRTQRKTGSPCAQPGAELVDPAPKPSEWLRALVHELEQGKSLDAVPKNVPAARLRSELQRSNTRYVEALREGPQIRVGYDVAAGGASKALCLYVTLTPEGAELTRIYYGVDYTWPCSGLTCPAFEDIPR